MSNFTEKTLTAVYCTRCDEEADSCVGCGKSLCFNCDTTYGDVEGMLCQGCADALSKEVDESVSFLNIPNTETSE